MSTIFALQVTEMFDVSVDEPKFDSWILGVFDSQDKAEIAYEACLQQIIDQGDEDIVFLEIIEYALNCVEYKLYDEKSLGDEIEELVKKGLVDYKIGEDGEFYFDLTEKGQDLDKWIDPED